MKKIIQILIVLAIMNFAATSIIDRFNNPKLTETELMLRLPKAFLWQFNV